MSAGQLNTEHLDRYIAAVRREFEATLGALVEIPTVSADAERQDDIRRAAELAAQHLRALGARAEAVETPGNPVVLGRLEASAAAPTVTFYNHLDVQPAQEPEWTSDPFAFRAQDGRYEGRGTTDDKGPAVTALYAIRYAREIGLPVNIRVIWELEEEIGSPSFEAFILARRRDLDTDSVLVSDTVWLSRETPALPYGLRGLQGARLILETAQRDAHSGSTGGAARNPVGELCQVISRCYDAATGRVHLPGFYNDVAPVSEQEVAGFLAAGFRVAAFKRAYGLSSLRSEDPRDVLLRIWCQPTFEVHGIAGGYTGPGIKTVVPPRAEAKLSMRLVPRQEPLQVLRLLTDFVHQVNPDVRVESAGSLRPYLGDFKGPHNDAARRAIQFAFGREPAFTREGGSIGAVVTMQQHLRAPIVFMGLSLPEHGYHAPNEHFDWAQAAGGIKAMVKYLSEVAQMPRRA